MHKLAQFSTLTEGLNAGITKEQLLSLISSRKKELKRDGRYNDSDSAGFMGPHTAPTGWALPALLKNIGSIIGISDPAVRRPAIYVGNKEDQKSLMKMVGLEPDFYSKRRPKFIDDLQDAIGAHEILEAEAMDADPKWVNSQTRVAGSAQLGTLLGALGGGAAAVLLPEVAGIKRKIPISSRLYPAALGSVGGGYLGFMLGGIGGLAADALKGGGGGWASHLSADVPRLESRMLNIINDPDISDVFRTMRTQTGERGAMQRVGVDVGDMMPSDILDKLSKEVPTMVGL